MTDPVPDVPLRSTRRSLWERMSVVWLVPVAALAIALGVAWQAWVDQGPVIEILFDDAAGVAANETELRYRNVTVGLVEAVRFTEGLDRVSVLVRLDKTVADYVDAGAQFWVVRPEVTTQGVTGLDTVLSGVYLEGVWDTVPGELVEQHVGLASAPLLGQDEQGLRIVLQAADGSLTGSAPLLYKGVTVGQVGPAQISADGVSVTAEAVIFSPYDALVTTATRFWDTSGFSLSIGTGGASVNFDSIASLIAGGITFDTFVSGALLAEDGQEFVVYADEVAARNSVFNQADGPSLMLTAVFDGNVSGLATGSAVELNGLRIGEVTGLNGVVEQGAFGDDVRLQTVLAIRPARLGFTGAGADQATLDFLAGEVAEGLRARLVTGNILTGSLKVQFVYRPEEAPGRLDLDAAPYPAIPATASDIADVSATAQGTLDRINDLPIEELLQSTRTFLDNASTLIGSEDIQATPKELRALLAEIRAVVAADETQALPDRLGTLLTQLETTVAEVNTLLASIEEQEGVERVLSAVDGVSATVTALNPSIERLPGLIDQIGAVGAQISALELADLVTRITAVTDSADALLSSEGVTALPDTVTGAVAGVEAAVSEVRALVADVNEQGGVERLLAAVDAAQAAATSLQSSLEGVPAVVARVEAIAAQIEALELQALVDQAGAVLASADAILGTEGAQALPGELGAALDELRQVMADLREGGVVENANATFATARTTLEDIAAATEGLPGLIDRTGALITQTSGVVAGFSDTSPVVRDLRRALREANGAAEAVARLARTLERNPNSLLIGR